MKSFIRRNVAEIAVVIGALVMIGVLGFVQQAHAADTYTPDLRIVQMPTGSNDTQWGIKANAAFAMLEQGIAGGTTISVTSGDVILTTANNAPDQSRNAIIAFTGTPGITRTVTMPNVSKLTWVVNSSDSTINFTAGAGITSSVASGNIALIYTDGVTNANAITNISAFGTTFTSATTAASARTALGLGSAATQPSSAFLQGSNNLSELTNAPTARVNLGLTAGATAQTALGLGSVSLLNLGGSSGLAASAGNLVVTPGTGIQIAGNAVAVSSDVMLNSANFSGLTSTQTARHNLGNGSLNVPMVTVSTGAPSGSGTNNGDLWMRVQ